MKSKIINATKLFIAAVLLVTGTGIVSAFTAPTQTAPGGNVAAPINTSITDQTKSGGIGANFFVGKQGVFCKGVGAYCSPFASDILTAILPGYSVAGPNSQTTYPAKGIRVATNGDIYILDGNQTPGYVLTADANGKATWQVPQTAPPPPPSTQLPTGTRNQTLRNDGTVWTANSNLLNNGLNVGIGGFTPPSSPDTGYYKLGVGTPNAPSNAVNRLFVAWHGGRALMNVVYDGTKGRTTILDGFTYSDGTQGAGKVLTSDASGNASWQNPPSSSNTALTTLDGLMITFRCDEWNINGPGSYCADGTESLAQCPDSHPRIIAGGGQCTDGQGIQTSAPILNGTRQGWYVNCDSSRGTRAAFATCAK